MKKKKWKTNSEKVEMARQMKHNKAKRTLLKLFV